VLCFSNLLKTQLKKRLKNESLNNSADMDEFLKKRRRNESFSKLEGSIGEFTRNTMLVVTPRGS